MMIIIAPAKRMRPTIDFMDYELMPCFYEESCKLAAYMKTRNQRELKAMLSCSDAIAQWTFDCYQNMKLSSSCVPALLSFDGIQYSYMAPDLFSDEYFAYARKHLRILSGLYGILRPFDGVVPYRLELDSPFHTPFCTSLYDFWKDKPYQALIQEDRDILDLSSKQYGKIIKRHLDENVRLVTVYFLEEEEGRRREKGVYVKMARGEMVRWLAEQNIQSFEAVKGFCRLGYRFDAAASDEQNYRFVRKGRWKRGKCMDRRVDAVDSEQRGI